MAETHTPEVTIKIGGQAGFGIKAGGQALARVFAKAGLHTFDVTEYPSLIRGGHNVYRVRVSREPIYSHVESVNVLVALNQQSADLHMNEIVPGGAVIYDPKAVKDHGFRPENEVLRVPVALDDIAIEGGGDKIMRNTAAAAAILGVIGFPLSFLEDSLRAQFAKKSEQVREGNVKTAQLAYAAVEDKARDFPFKLEPNEGQPARLLVDGNESVGFGAMAAGLGIYCAYPMTPASGLLAFMARMADEHRFVVKHTEDEIAAMNMVVGAAFSGSRAMCATSGGGFSLMVEAFGLAGVTESAVVVGLFTRPGPATGLPTWTEQSDLRLIIHAAQGEFPRVVLAPGDREDAFDLTWQAFNLADQLQTPVVILSDSYLQESRATCDMWDTSRVTIDRGKLQTAGEAPADYSRYDLDNEDGVSLRALPGVVGANQIVNSYEHDMHGWATEDPNMRTAQDEKRMRKMELARRLAPKPAYFGPDDADLSLIVFGSTKGPAREALKWAERDGMKVNLMQVVTVWPFPTDEVAAFLGKAKRTMCVEGDLTGQLQGLIRQECLMDVDETLHRYDGRPFSPEQIAEKIRSVLGVREEVLTHA